MGIYVAVLRTTTTVLLPSDDIHRETDVEGGVHEAKARDDNHHRPVDDERQVPLGVCHVAENKPDLREE